jgi:molybdate transport system ATP-binding protein
VIDLQLRLDRGTPHSAAGFSLDVALALPERGVSALFGPSGCGKTTLLRALAGLEPAARGRVALGPRVWQDDAAGVRVPTHQRALGYVFQDAALLPHLDVQRNLAFGQHRVAPAARRVPLEQAVELLGLGALMARRPATLSGGERQRVAIARALASSPDLLLMDEPLAALDAARKAEILPYLERLNSSLAIPLVYVSHAIDEVARLADHLVLLDAGHVVADGPLAAMLARIDLPLARGEDAGVVLRGVVGARDAAWHLARLDVPHAGPANGDATFSLWSRDQGLAVGQPVRLRVLARDVSLTRAPQTQTSIGNQLACRVEAIAPGEHPALALVRVRVVEGSVNGGSPGPVLVARLTQRSAHALGLEPGLAVWAQVKTVALI